MNPELQNAILQGLKDFAAAVTGIAPQVWAMMLSQQIIIGVWNIAVTLIFLLSGAFMVVHSIGKALHFQVEERRWCNSKYSNDNNARREAEIQEGKSEFQKNIHYTLIAVGAVLLLVGLLFFATIFGDGIGRLINPGYYAVTSIITMLNPK